MSRNLRNDLFAIWKAGVLGVNPKRLIEQAIDFDRAAQTLWIDDTEISLQTLGRIVVVGAGKASGEMAAALESRLLPLVGKKRLTGWVNVPNDCLLPTEVIHLHGARPAGLNEPTPDGVAGSREIIRLLHSLNPHDLCICLLSGGGSALLPAPIPEITLEEKIELTRFLSASGANIEELNTIRKQLSVLKGGGLARLCSGKQMIGLILSDVLGDPLDVIASGPTVENPTTANDALPILDRFTEHRRNMFPNIRKVLLDNASKNETGRYQHSHVPIQCKNIILGNNPLAVDAAGVEAEKQGYSHAMISSRKCEGSAEEVGNHLATVLENMLSGGPNCLISGGEPTVRLPDPAQRGKGGRNQQLVLAALVHLLRKPITMPIRFGLLSGGTDGEDGPTDAAGAWIDSTVLQNILQSGLDPVDFLNRCDAYTFFDRVGGLLKTGPTGTNVCDLRIIVVDTHRMGTQQELPLPVYGPAPVGR